MGREDKNTNTRRAVGKPRGNNMSKTYLTILFLAAAVAFYFNLHTMHYFADDIKGYDNAPTSITKRNPKGKIAIMSSFVPNQNTKPPPRLKEAYFDHIINKACYSYIWGYDYIFNTTYAFDDTYKKDWHWLAFGTWHRVPHVQARIREYDWILYTDTDVLIQDIMRPLESFISEWELYGKTNVQLFVPVDSYATNTFTFSAFAFMIRNSSYGHTILKYWDDFARVSLFLDYVSLSYFYLTNMLTSHSTNLPQIFTREYVRMATLMSLQMESIHGLTLTSRLHLHDCARLFIFGCEYNMSNSTNFSSSPIIRPGLWYAMARAYQDFFPDRVPNDHNYPLCNETTGVLDKHTPPWNDFFRAMTNLTKGSTGRELDRVPNDQPYIYSSLPNELRSGMALQLNWGITKEFVNKYQGGAFALHLKDNNSFPQGVVAELDYCRKNLGCYAHYDDMKAS